MTDERANDPAAWLEAFAAALEARDIGRAAGLFLADGFWRDFIAFSWNIATFEGEGQIAAMLDQALPTVAPGQWRIEGEPEQKGEVTEAWITFETALGRGRGYLRMKAGRAWTLLTSLYELKGFEEPLGRRRPTGVIEPDDADRRTWLERRRQEAAELGVTRQPYVLIVGGGQGGLALGARLKMLGVPTLIVDRLPRAGDQWRSRYKSLALHDPVWADHMPYLPFPAHWPVFTPKDKMGDWLEAYAQLMELNLWTSTECVAAAHDEAAGTWSVTVEREGRPVVLRPTHLVLALGTSGKPIVPAIPGAETFAGAQHHSSAHPGGDAFAGQRVVVVGSNNSAHDICADLWEHGADVTMVQRSSTHVARSKTLTALGRNSFFSEDAVERGLTTDKADLLAAVVPLRLQTEAQKAFAQALATYDADFYARLEAAGFMHDFGEDGSGLGLKYLRRASGYYIDVGASDLVASGDIKLKSRVGIDRIEPDGLVLSDGEKLPADVIVYATGFGPMDQWAAELISPEVAARVGRCWGYGSNTTHDPGPWEGELRNMWKPTRQDGLWFHGGNLQLSRHFSIYLALQLKARLEGLPFRVVESAKGEAARAREPAV